MAEDGGRCRPSSLPQFFHRSIRCEQRAGRVSLPSHDDFQKFLGGGQRQLAHAEIVDDQQRHRGQQFHVLFALAVQRGNRPIPPAARELRDTTTR